MIMQTWSVDKIVVGSCLRSALYARANDCTLIYNGSSVPYFFEDVYERWNKEIFHLSLLGKVPFSDRVKSLRVRGNVINVTYGGAFVAKVAFKKCYVFDDNLLDLENEILEKDHQSFKVVDWMNVRRLSNTQTCEIVSEENFVSKIVLYESGRIDSDRQHKDAVVLSYLSEDQLLDFNFSDTMCKFKTRKVLEENGMIGTVNRIDKKTGKTFRHRIDLNVVSRDVVRVGFDKYKSSSLVEFPEISLASLLE